MKGEQNRQSPAHIGDLVNLSSSVDFSNSQCLPLICSLSPHFQGTFARFGQVLNTCLLFGSVKIFYFVS